MLNDRTLSCIYLDNTFATESEKFPSQKEAYNTLLQYIEERRKVDKTLKFYIYCYTLGKEEVFFNLAEHFKTKIRVDKDRYNKLKAIGMGESYFVTKKMEGDKTVKPFLFMKPMRDLPKTKEDVDVKANIIHVVLTGWKNQYNIKHPRYLKIPYSSHSSASELETFLKALKP